MNVERVATKKTFELDGGIEHIVTEPPTETGHKLAPLRTSSNSFCAARPSRAAAYKWATA